MTFPHKSNLGGRPKGSKDFSELEKKIIVDTISEYSLFNTTDKEIIAVASERIGRNLTHESYSRIKKQSVETNAIAIEWLDRYTRGEIINHYWKRIKEIELTQRILITEFINESKKADQGEKGVKKNKYLMDKFAKTIRENAQALAELGMSPPVLAYLNSLIPKDIIPINTDEMSIDKAKAMLPNKTIVTVSNESNTNTTAESEPNRNNDEIDINPANEQTAIFPPTVKDENNRPTGSTQGKINDTQDEQRVF